MRVHSDRSQIPSSSFKTYQQRLLLLPAAPREQREQGFMHGANDNHLLLLRLGRPRGPMLSPSHGVEQREELCAGFCV